MASKSKPELSQKPKAWAELRDMLHKENADFLELTQDYATFGRSSLQEGQEGHKFSPAGFNVFLISRKHFSIHRERSDEDENSNPPILTCHSDNGMMINELKLHKGDEKILLSGDSIKLNHTVELYTFKDLRETENFYPQWICKKYFIGKLLGKGLFGKVSTIHNITTMKKFAIKTIEIPIDANGNPKESRKRMAEHEIDIMMSLQHPNLMSLFEKAERNLYKFIIMELMDTDLLKYLLTFAKRRLPEIQAKFCFFQICKGLEYLHTRNIAHRDLKVQNIFIKFHDNFIQLRIGDFGFSRYDARGEFSTQIGTECFLAPELVAVWNKPSSGYTTKADIWSLGCILFSMLFGGYPFHSSYEGNMNELIEQGKYNRQLVGNVSETARLLIDSIFLINSLKRPSIRNILRSIWFDDAELRDEVETFTEKLELPSSYDTLNRSDETFLRQLTA